MSRRDAAASRETEPERVDLSGLEPEDVKTVKDLLAFLRARSGRAVSDVNDVQYRSWSLGVKGEVTRAEVYDYL